MTPKISPFLWFDTQAEDAARFYTGIFPKSRIVEITRYPDSGQEVHGKSAGSVMVVSFELDGLRFEGLNGGPQFKFSEAVSFVIDCEDQAEIDYYWEKLSEGVPPDSGQCGWLRDQFGLSWQIVPKNISELMNNADPEKSKRAFAAMMQMQKLDIAALKAAAG